MRQTHVAVLLLGLLVIGCEPAGPIKVKHANIVMGTQAEITAYAPDHATARRAIQAAYDRLSDVNRLMSDYVADSEVGRLNTLAPGESLVVSPGTFHCLQQATQISERSGGAFDITYRPLKDLWKRAAKENRLPADATLRDTLERVGWRKLQIDPATRAVTPTVADMQIDVGGIAKGYGLDLAAHAMRQAGVTSGLIDVGGDVVALGTQPNGGPWHVGVQNPLEPAGVYYCRLALHDCAVATSGAQWRFFEVNGIRYSHIIDPRTGWPAAQAPSATVIGPDGLTADAWATVFSILSVDEGQALLDTEALPAIEVLWLTRAGGRVVGTHSPGFARYIAE